MTTALAENEVNSIDKSLLINYASSFLSKNTDDRNDGSRKKYYKKTNIS